MPLPDDRDKDSLDLRLLFQLIFWILLSGLFLSMWPVSPSSTPKNSPFADLEVRDHNNVCKFLMTKLLPLDVFDALLGEAEKGGRERGRSGEWGEISLA